MRKLYLATLAAALLALTLAPPARAVGTLAGSVITNQAYGDCSDNNGNAMPRVYSNTVTAVVTQVGGAQVVPPAISSAAKNGDVIYYLAQLWNPGNGFDTQTFTYSTSGDWTPTSVRFWYDINNSHSYDAGDLLLAETSPGSKTYHTVNNLGAPVKIDPDDDYDVMVEVTVPAVVSAPNGTSSVITITTTSDYDNTKTATGTYTTTVLAAAISVVNSHTPTGTPTLLMPGETVTYTTTLTNSGSIDATGVTYTDLIPANLTYTPGTIIISINGGGATARTDGADNDGAKYDSATRSIIAPDGLTGLTIPAGQTWTITFQATVNAEVPTQTPVTNQSTLTYTSGGSTVTVSSNGDTFFVTTISGIDITSTAGPQTGDPGDRIVYAISAHNKGNASDVIELTQASTTGWSWAFWADSNSDGIPGNNGDYLLTDTDHDGRVDTGTLAQNGNLSVLAVATIPPGTGNGTVDHLTVTATSGRDATKTKAITFSTTVRAPILNIAKALIAVQAPGGGAVCTPTDTRTGSPCKVVPGSILTYTVTASNTGNGNMTNLVVTDLLPQFTTYNPGTILTGSSSTSLMARTDTNDSDGAEYNSASNTIIVPDGTTLTIGPGGTWVLKFSITVN